FHAVHLVHEVLAEEVTGHVHGTSRIEAARQTIHFEFSLLTRCKCYTQVLPGLCGRPRPHARMPRITQSVVGFGLVQVERGPRGALSRTTQACHAAALAP